MTVRRLLQGLLAAAAALAVPAAGALAGEIRGRVLVGPSGAAGVAVSAVPFEDGAAVARREARGEALPRAVATATTRPDGTFLLVLPAPAAGAVVQLAFSGGAVAPVVLDRLLDAGGEDAGDVRLPRAESLAGRVVDERGGPVVGAVVTLWPGRARGFLESAGTGGVPQTTTTKPDGSFRFDTAAEEGNRLRVEAPAMATVERDGVRSGALARPVVLAVGQVRRGTVTQADRRTPVGGALVRFEGRTRTRWVETRADGAFALDGAPRESGALVADAGDRGRGTVAVPASGGEPVAIALAPTATLSGRVVDQDTGRPVSGVRVVARGVSGGAFVARSGADGRYALRGLPPQSFRLVAEDERFVPFSRAVTVAAGVPETQDVPLVRAAALSGRVVDEQGAPIEGASVTVSPSGENVFASFARRFDGEARVRSGRDGTFRATRLRPGDGQRVDVRHDDYAERTVAGLSLAAGVTRTGLTIVMRRGLALRGVARDESGRPLAGVEVTLSAGQTLRAGRGGVSIQMVGAGSQVRRETGPDGRFEFRGLKAGDYSLAGRRAGYGRASVDPVKVAEGAAEPVALVLRPGATITGLLHDKSGTGVAGWLVVARPSGQGGGPGMGPDAIRGEEATGPDGVFVLEGLTAGESYDLQVMGTAGMGPRRAGVVAPADGVDLTVTGTGQIRGRVVDADSGRPVPDFQVRYVPDAQGGMRFVMRMGPGRQRGPFEKEGFHAEDGAFTVDDVPAGRWMVEAFARGYQNGSAAGIVVGEGEAAEGVELRLSRGSVVSGRVVESRAGRPVLGATVRAEQAGGEGRMMIRLGGEQGELEALTDAEGRYEIAGLSAGSWTLTASHPDWSDASARVEIKDAAASADLKMGRGGAVAGSVVAGGRPVGGAQVVLQQAGDSGFRMSAGMFGGGEQQATTDEGGRFRFERLTPGRYSAVATLREQASAPAEAVVTGDEAQEVQLVLAQGARVRGVVSGLPEAQLSGVNVTGQSGGDYFASTRTGGGGAFELTGVPEGPLTLRATSGDFVAGGSRSAQASLTIAPGQAEAAAEIVFEPGFRVDGHVTRGGRPVVDATVMASPETPGRPTASSRTDETGGYLLEGLQEGRYSITAMGTDSAPIRQSVALTGDTTVDLEAPPAKLAGVVVDADGGRPLAEVAVRIEDGSAATRFVSMATTDSAGRFAFEDLEPRSYRVTFQKAAYEADTRELVASESSDARVELRRGDGVVLEARDGLFATPLRGLFVRVVDGAGNAAFAGSVTLDGEGRGEIPALKAGSYELRAESQGYAPVRLPLAVPSRTLTLALTPGGTLEIQAGPQTLAVPDSFGRLLGGDGRPYLPSVFSADGRIGLGSPVRRLENVAPGRYVFEASSGVRRDVTVTEGGRAAVALP
ncbi:MAG: carboxypeptidase regulatory-like domain-containing protein [Vicinamibacteria bacterium]